MSDFMGVNLEFKDFDRLLKKDEMVEEPVPIEVFVQDKRYLGLPPLSEIQLEIVRHSTQIYKKHTLQNLMGEKAGLDWYDKYTDNEVICMLGKGCHDANTPIFNPENGKWEPLSSMVTDHVVSHDGSHHFSTQPFLEGYGKMLRVKTSLGFEERVYVGHKYYSYKTSRFYKRNERVTHPDWYRIDNLNVGDRVAIGINFDVMSPKDIDPAHAELIGYWLGDGSLPNDNNQLLEMVFCADEHESISRYMELCEIIGDSPNIVDLRPKKNAISIRHQKLSNAVRICRDYGLWNQYPHDKEIPDQVWASSNSILAMTISKLWETDGCVYKKNGYTAEFVSVSEELALGVQRALLRLGIPSSIRSRIPKTIFNNASRAWYVTVSSDECIQAFFEKISLLDHKNVVLPVKNGRVYRRKEDNIYWDKIVSIEPDGEDDYWTRTVPDTGNYIGNGFVSHNSGKDHCARISIAYTSYLLHCLNDPISYYGKAKGVYIDLLNLAVNAQQAQRVFFEPLKNLLLSSPYFNEVGFEPRVSEIFFFSRPVRCFSGHSESEGWEGYEVLTVILDEISAFKIDSELRGELRSKGSASAIYNMSKLSVMSRFPEVGKVILLSFPRYKGDFIQQRFNSAIQKSEPKTWTIKASTWEVNPTIKREDLESEYIRNPIEARARFECEPPNMEDAFFRDPDLVRKAFHYSENPVDEEDGSFKNWFNGTDAKTRFIHVDLSLKRDRTALCMVHSGGFKEIKTSMGVETLPVVNMDLIHSWEAKPGAEINFSAVRQMIVDLCRKFDVAKVTFDRWQSIEMVQSLKALGINADFHSVKKSDYDTLLTSIYDGRLRGYWDEILVEEELLKLRLFNNNKIDHPSSGSKDLADALAGAVYSCVENISSDQEIEIELMYPSKEIDFDEDMPDFGNVRRYNADLGEFENAYSKNETGKWLDNL